MDHSFPSFVEQEEEFLVDCVETWRVGPEPEREEVRDTTKGALANVCVLLLCLELHAIRASTRFVIICRFPYPL